MNIADLKEKLIELQVNPSYYSLNQGLKSDAIMLNSYHNTWEVFYLDERGGKHDEFIFSNENDACLYIYDRFKNLKSIKENIKQNLKSDDDKLPNIINL
ncbi:hypothetical protein [Flavobacterium daejeonense]|uniref:hypothetical protein n=1 Tax=Flavobacterium daejeonense TaxID=350893 RepID=UPI000AE99D2C|nr:hypothetical protein [Flavobacterium daejeonense]